MEAAELLGLFRESSRVELEGLDLSVTVDEWTITAKIGRLSVEFHAGSTGEAATEHAKSLKLGERTDG